MDLNVNHSKHLVALSIIAGAMNTDLNVNDIQLRILAGIRDLFEAEGVVLILLDVDNPELAIKKSLLNLPDWVSHASLKLEDGLVAECIRTRQPMQLENPAAEPGYNRHFDAVHGVEMHSLTVVPLVTNGQTLGAIQVVNIPEAPLSEYDLGLLMSMAKSLASSIFGIQLIQQLKVANADLEVSRWELLHSRNTLRALFDSIPASIYIIDRKYNLVAINMSRAERVNKKPNQLVGKKCYEVLYQRSDPCPGCRVSETLLTGKTTNRTDRQWLNNEQPIEWEISSFAIIDGSNLPLQAILLEADVTEKRRLEANLIQSEKLAAVGQLAAGVAHEINNPLSAIIANAQMLRRDLPPDQDLEESVNLIEQAGLRASQVVRNLLNFARKEKYDFSPTDVNDTIQSALVLLQHEFVSRSLGLQLDLEDHLPRINASRDHLQGVWTNLVMNAIDAMDNENGEIAIATHATGSEIRVTVRDNGKGIPQERVSRIFEPFFTTKEAGHGTGLGLSVCHRIVKQHGGYIQVESQLGKGTIFTVTLPTSGK